MQETQEFGPPPPISGDFLVKLVSFEWAKSYCPPHLDIIRGCWRGLFPHRIELFTWLSLLGKINTKAKLVNIGILTPSDSCCVFCNYIPKTCDHLLLHYDYSWKIRRWWLDIWEVSWIFPSYLPWGLLSMEWFLSWSIFHESLEWLLLCHCLVLIEGKKRYKFFQES